MCIQADQHTVDCNNTDPEAKKLDLETIYTDTAYTANNIR